MSAHPPPVPPEQKSPFGGASSAGGPASEAQPDEYKSQNRNLGEQGRQGDIKQNTTHQGYQQDR